MADKGQARAQTILSVMIEGRLGVPADPKRAVELCKDAENQGFPAAMSNLGWVYEHGIGVLTKDDVMDREWYWKATELNCGPAINNLGFLLLEGGGAADPETALAVFERGAAFGYADATVRLA